MASFGHTPLNRTIMTMLYQLVFLWDAFGNLQIVPWEIQSIFEWYIKILHLFDSDVILRYTASFEVTFNNKFDIVIPLMCWFTLWILGSSSMVPGVAWLGLLPDTQNCELRMHRECRERFPRHWLQRKQLVSDPGMHHGTCVTHVPWCTSGSLTCSGGENVTEIPGACVTRNFAYLVKGPWMSRLVRVARKETSCYVHVFAEIPVVGCPSASIFHIRKSRQGYVYWKCQWRVPSIRVLLERKTIIAKSWGG